MPNCDSDCMNVFLRELSHRFPEDHILLCCDGAAWHKSKALQVPANITLFHIPPYTPEMNPIEQIWRELRCQGFRNEILYHVRQSKNAGTSAKNGPRFLITASEARP